MSQDLSLHLDSDYKLLLNTLKTQIKSAQFRAALTVNQAAITLYWHIGKQIIDTQKQKVWGSNFIDTLSHDLQNSFPETHGYSAANLRRMRRFAEEYPDIDAICAQAVRKLGWGHIIVLIQRVEDAQMREWYVTQALENGWSRPTLEKYIRQNLYQSQSLPSNKASNFLERLPLPQSALAQEILKSPYNFDFLGLHDDAHEREIEHASIAHITKFLLELGKGFAFVGRQYPIEIDDETYFIDILMYHLKLRAFVVCELKAKKFKPEHAGQLNFYLNLVDNQLKTAQDNPTIGLLLCKSRSKVIAEYALKGIEKPIGVSEYQLTKAIPENLKANLPSIEEIEAELNDSDQYEIFSHEKNAVYSDQHFKIQLVESDLAEKICHDITTDLPNYFGIPKANERYAKGILECISFAAIVNNQYAGLLTLEFPFENNAHIYWMAIKNKYQGQNMGSSLVEKAVEYCREKGCTSLTVETLSPKNKNADYLKTYRFYEKCYFKPLFELNTYAPDSLMVYMQRLI